MQSVCCFCLILTEAKFGRQISVKTFNVKVTKSRPVGAEFLHADKKTDMTKLIVAFAVVL
jgi:hypothetical protein